MDKQMVKLLTLIFFYKVYVLSMLISNEDIAINFNLSKKVKCLPSKWANVVHTDVSLEKCVLYCGQRYGCLTLNYKRQFLLCELFSSSVVKEVEPVDQPRHCVALNKEVMTITTAVRNCNCRDDQTCDLGHCIQTVCKKLQIENGNITGNMNEVGSRIEYSCHKNYAEVAREKNSTCKANGFWTHVPKCIRDCYESKTYPNSTVTPGLTTEGTTRTYICDDFYMLSIDSDNTQTICESNGEWTQADFRCVLNYQYLGCFKSDKVRMVEYWMFDHKTTPEFCVEHCFSLNFSFALIEAMSHCFCGNQMAYANETEENECDHTCSGDPTLTCGGSWRAPVFRRNRNSTYLGCYRDANPDRILSGHSVLAKEQAQMTTDICIDLCRNLGYKFAGTENANECFCGGVVLKVEKRPENECNFPCSANKDEFCGGVGHASIYTTD